MVTGPDGQRLTVHDRLAEIGGRYGPDSLVGRFIVAARPELLAAVERTLSRMADAGTSKGVPSTQYDRPPSHPDDPGMNDQAEHRDELDVLSDFLHAEPGRIQRLLDRHVRRPDGGCSCSYPYYLRWPCSVADLAMRARRDGPSRATGDTGQ